MSDRKPFIVDAPIMVPLASPRGAFAPARKPNLTPSLISAAGLQSLEIPKRPRLLGDWLCQGDLGYLFAPRGCGKTWLMLAILAAVSQGKALGEWQAGEAPVRTLYLDGEMPLELLRYRSHGLGLDQGDVTFLHHYLYYTKEEAAINIARPEDRQAITDVLVAHGFSMLILDNLSSLACGIDENKGGDYEGVAEWLLELRRREITVIVVHHAGRNGLMRGHSKREDACSWILQLNDAKADGEQGAKFTSHFAKASRNTGDPQPDLMWHFTSDKHDKVGIACTVAVNSEFEIFVEHVRDGVESSIEIAELMGKPRGTISKWVSRAVRDGRICRKGNQLTLPEDVFGGDDEDGET